MDAQTTAILGALASGLTGAVKLYRTAALQERLDPRLRWDNLTIVGKLGLVVGTSAVGAALTALAGGMSWGAAGAAAVVAASSAIGFDQLTDAGKYAAGLAQERGVKSTLSRPSSLVWKFPTDRDVVDEPQEPVS